MVIFFNEMVLSFVRHDPLTGLSQLTRTADQILN